MMDWIMIALIVWPTIGLVGYILLVRSMLTWDRFDSTYVVIFFMALLTGPYIWPVTIMELLNPGDGLGKRRGK